MMVTDHGGKLAAQAELNAGVWRTGRYLTEYDRAHLEPAEALLLARYRDDLSGRVLDVGCGAGRFLNYLVALGAEAHGLDIAPRMVAHCLERFPGVDVRVGDLRSLPETVEGPFDAILLSDNVLDVLDDDERRSSLADIHGLLAHDGLLVFSSHNLWAWEHPLISQARRPGPARMLMERPLGWVLRCAWRLPRRRANRRRLAPRQRRASEYAIVNDASHDFGLLHYYISRAQQERQLSELGFRPIEVLEFDGRPVAGGENGRGGSLYYAARAV